MLKMWEDFALEGPTYTTLKNVNEQIEKQFLQ